MVDLEQRVNIILQTNTFNIIIIIYYFYYSYIYNTIAAPEGVGVDLAGKPFIIKKTKSNYQFTITDPSTK